jgi:transposase
MPDQPMYHSQILDHLGLIAGMFDELSIGDVLDHATHQNPEMRDLTVGEAVNAMVLNGLGCINQALDLVPRFFHHTPTSRLISPRVVPAQRNDDALGRALDTLYADGVTELYRLIAATAAERLGLAPRFTPLDRTSFHVDGRYTSDEEPEAQVIHMTRGYRRDHRPDLNQVMLELMVEHQAGIPILMTPLRGHSSDAHRFGELVRTPIDPLHTPYGMTYLVADSALDREDNLAKLSQTQMQWLTRVPATVSEAQAALAQVNPQTMMPLSEGYRGQMLHSTYGRVAQRWALISSERHQPQAQRTADRPWRKQRDQDRNAFPKRCRPAFACEADAQQALRAFEQGLQVTPCPQVTIRPVAYSGKRGRPGPGA